MYKPTNNLMLAVEHDTGQYALILSKVLGICALLLATGLYFGDTSSSNYEILLELFSHETWAAIFALYGTAKIIQGSHRLPSGIDIVICAIGIWLWNYIFLSFVVFDFKNFTAIEILLLLPVACEVWELALEIFAFRVRRSKNRGGI